MNDTELYLLIHKPGTKDEFEALEEVSGKEFEYEYPQKKKEEKKKEEDAEEWAGRHSEKGWLFVVIFMFWSI